MIKVGFQINLLFEAMGKGRPPKSVVSAWITVILWVVLDTVRLFFTLLATRHSSIHLIMYTDFAQSVLIDCPSAFESVLSFSPTDVVTHPVENFPAVVLA